MRAIVNVSTGRYSPGADRLDKLFSDFEGMKLIYRDQLPQGSPVHEIAPYAFKAFAMLEAFRRGATDVLWCDASVVPYGDMEKLWGHIEERGYWIADNGWNTGQWCIDEALGPLGITREQSWEIPHPVATAFAVSSRDKEVMSAFEEWVELADKGVAFRGPWRIPPCIERLPGPRETGGHRHDQTALGVVAWRHGLNLTERPKFFSYRGGETVDTCLLAVGI